LPATISAIVFDFDGVFTDNRVMVFEDGREAVLCHRGDGLGLGQLKNLGIPILVLSTEKNPVVQARSSKLCLECRQGCDDKLTALQTWLKEVGADASTTIYVGNDANDLACLKSVGCPVIVADAHPSVRDVALLTLSAPGGFGALRELCDLIVAKTHHTK
jgi:N-acylneuraminate cytidylyltransferase